MHGYFVYAMLCIFTLTLSVYKGKVNIAVV